VTTLLCGPWLAEFGWEVATWIPAMRAYSTQFQKTIVLCRDGHEYLYNDFCNDFMYDNRIGAPDRWLLNGKKVYPLIKSQKDCTVISAREKHCMDWPRQYRRYGQKMPNGYDIVFHARAETKYGQKKLNWAIEKYIETAEWFKGLKMCCVGTKAHDFPGVEDKRNISLEQLCNVLASAKVMLSPSSGPAHLASLCGCPHVVLTDDKYQKQIRATNRKRYEYLWNPFNTSCTILDKDNWHPSPKKVIKALGEYL
jgi:hypothetical protein